MLRSILRAVAIVDGLVCLYALIQACALTVQERRRTVAVLRACGAGAAAVRRLLAGAALALVVPAAVVGILLERLVLGPALSRLAASYATLPLGATGRRDRRGARRLGLAGAVAVAWVARQATRESVIAGMGGAVTRRLTRREALADARRRRAAVRRLRRLALGQTRRRHRVDARLDLGRSRRHRDARAGPGRAADRPHRARSARSRSSA